ncbi:thiol reductant ABC exporter subunit CydD [Siccirubricoccus deserti]|uniref:Thiol reductant ABC exporter subunit CydD n=1 Tax=Siccirubricoccus deserti TaxID=2013562 RepID=A0A9X0UCJ4_9PROT|nr:thiol reductant ABC exporter subunit CydD [Siccirubricoccus deserti]MBC4015297.1 thiol reductant ABC exporter subunit CydD [Siccirubricoccus deserti]GGC40508.1 thiol reductant ABC exporter subunit CydD [Siccirubricoccus deserti]
MITPGEGNAGAARALLRQQSKALRGHVLRPVAFGLAATITGLLGAWLVARLVAALLGHPGAGWDDLAATGALALLGIGLGLAQERSQLAAGEAARARLRDAAFARLLALGPADPRGVGERASLVVDRIEALDGYFARWLPAAALALLAPLVVIVAAFMVDGRSALVLAIAGLLYPIAMALTGIGAAAASRRQFESLERLSGRFLDRMRGLPTLVLFNRQEEEATALGTAADELRARTMRVLRIAFLSGTAMELLAAGAIACTAWRYGGFAGDPTAGVFALLLVPAFFAPLRAFSAAYHERLAATGAAAALAPLLDRPAAEGLALEAMPPRVVVTFSDVRLSYDPARAPALDGLSFRVNAGETLVLAGPSGAGKSSVLRLLMGFIRPDAGRMAINGQDAMALRPEELRRLSSYIGQKPHLFRGSIRENIRFARPEATAAQVEAAAQAARVTDFAAALPEGLDTAVGEGGWGLSGGQAQRVALARAFLRDTPLVLLDEPTAHLDPGTEAEVIESLQRLCLGRTAIIASHSGARAQLGRVLEIAAGRVPGTARQVPA